MMREWLASKHSLLEGYPLLLRDAMAELEKATR